jgi:hypothetical protein
MNTANADDLERRAAEVRAHLESTFSELERAMHVRPEAEDAEKAARHPEDATGPSTRSESSDEVSHELSADADGDVDTAERRRLEHRADRVRKHLADTIATLENKARAWMLPIAVAAGALALLNTAAFAWMFYRTMKRR